jgi:DNA-binding FadR family transcriptional regulator
VAINHADIDFHRQLCELSGNRIATTLWQAIARHIWIVFGWEIRSETSIAGMVEQHERLARALTSSSDSKAEEELIQHIRRRRH